MQLSQCNIPAMNDSLSSIIAHLYEVTLKAECLRTSGVTADLQWIIGTYWSIQDILFTMRSIVLCICLTMLTSTDILTEGYIAKPVIRRMISTSNSVSIRNGRRFVLSSAEHSATLTERSSEQSSEVPFVLGAPFSGLVADFKRRRPYYKSDWTDGFKKKSLAAILFLYFACLGEQYDTFAALLLLLLFFLGRNLLYNT